MNREQLAHILRSASRIADDVDVLVVGSQAILGRYDEAVLPWAATSSLEADITFIEDPGRDKADQVEGAIGEMSMFHETNGYYAEGIHIDTVILPDGWRDRLITWNLQSAAPARARFLEPHDLAVSKLAAGRPKDLVFVEALLSAQMIDRGLLRQRAELLADPQVTVRVLNWLST
jgi:hypothetical protein